MKRPLILAAALSAAAAPVWAHHPLGGLPMETFAHGLLSGAGHPLLGFDHLFFVCAAGIVAAYARAPVVAMTAYLGAMCLGCLMMAAGVGLPLKEAVIALSLVVVGSVIASGRVMRFGGLVTLLAAFGLFHGSAFGDSLAGQEIAAGPTVLVGYLIGLSLLQALVACGAGWAVRHLFNAVQPSAIAARLTGALVAGMGLLLFLEFTEGAVIEALQIMA